MVWYRIADLFFLVFHSLVILINLLGWIWKPMRKINLTLILLTAGSWVVLGFFYGFGYCPLTEWHFAILRKLGRSDLPASYIKYLADRLTGLNFNQQLVDQVTLWGLVLALICSLFVNFALPRLGKQSAQ